MKAEVLYDFFHFFLPALLLGLPPFLVLAWLCSRRSPLSNRARDRVRHAAPFLVWFIAVVEFYFVPCTTPPAPEGSAVAALTIAFCFGFCLALVRKRDGLPRSLGVKGFALWSVIALLAVVVFLMLVSSW